MKHLRLFAVVMLVAFAFACFFSMPVLSGDEDPWDADDGSDFGTESSSDTDDDSAEWDLYMSGHPGISDWLLGLMFRSSCPFVISYLLNLQASSNDGHSHQGAAGKTDGRAPGVKGSPRGTTK